MSNANRFCHSISQIHKTLDSGNVIRHTNDDLQATQPVPHRGHTPFLTSVNKMGQRGPAKTPTKIVELRGNPGHRINRAEPVARKRRPKAPPVIASNKAAMVHWRALIALTESMDVLREPDGPALAKLAQCEADYDQITSEIKEEGNLITNERTGMPHINPLLKRQAELINMIWRAYREFGFTPAARAGLRTDSTAKPADNDTDWSGF